MEANLLLLPLRILIFVLRELGLMGRYLTKHGRSTIIFACFAIIGYLALYYGSELLLLARLSFSLAR